MGQSVAAYVILGYGGLQVREAREKGRPSPNGELPLEKNHLYLVLEGVEEALRGSGEPSGEGAVL